MILPYIDQAPLYNQFNMSDTFGINMEHRGSTTNRVLQESTTIPLFLCPSDPFGKGPFSNYFLVSGGGPPDQSGCVADNTTSFVLFRNGMFFVNSNTRIADVTDGTSNTYMMAESKYMMDRSCPGREIKAGYWSGGTYS